MEVTPLQTAKMILCLMKKASIQELVLAEIIKTNGRTVADLVDRVPFELKISESQFRKTLHELYKLKVIRKDGITVFTNFNS